MRGLAGTASHRLAVVTRRGCAVVARLGLLGLVAVAATGCDPSCQRVCRKLVTECDAVETPRLGPEDCEAWCNNQEALYDEWQDTELRADFTAYKQCVVGEECGAIADGVCYDEDLYAF